MQSVSMTISRRISPALMRSAMWCRRSTRSVWQWGKVRSQQPRFTIDFDPGTLGASPFGCRSTGTTMRKLPRSFYDRDTVTVAQELLGKYLVHVVEGKPRVGRIVEAEAYLGP